jgi:hypothetical protein
MPKKPKYSLGLAQEHPDGSLLGNELSLEREGFILGFQPNWRLTPQQQQVVTKWQTNVLMMEGTLRLGLAGEYAITAIDRKEHQTWNETIRQFEATYQEAKDVLSEEFLDYLLEYTRGRLQRHAKHLGALTDDINNAIRRIATNPLNPDPEAKPPSFWEALFGRSR